MSLLDHNHKRVGIIGAGIAFLVLGILLSSYSCGGTPSEPDDEENQRYDLRCTEVTCYGSGSQTVEGDHGEEVKWCKYNEACHEGQCRPTLEYVFEKSQGTEGCWERVGVMWESGECEQANKTCS